jgi:hypothetical protein
LLPKKSPPRRPLTPPPARRLASAPRLKASPKHLPQLVAAADREQIRKIGMEDEAVSAQGEPGGVVGDHEPCGRVGDGQTRRARP